MVSFCLASFYNIFKYPCLSIICLCLLLSKIFLLFTAINKDFSLCFLLKVKQISYFRLQWNWNSLLHYYEKWGSHLFFLFEQAILLYFPPWLIKLPLLYINGCVWESSVLFHCSFCLFLHQHHIVLITIALE